MVGQPEASEKAGRPPFSAPPATALASASLSPGLCLPGLGEAADAPPDTWELSPGPAVPHVTNCAVLQAPPFGDEIRLACQDTEGQK